ncbi:hypothetical protein DFH06DRAFT_1299704 [Mycena polygramma]|nr:hypothetical protein DFH06DRAFT_1299704 [Mycena polygramma]
MPLFFPLPFLPSFSPTFLTSLAPSHNLRMSARPTGQLPSFNLVVNQAIFSETFVTVYWQNVSYNQPQPTDGAHAAVSAMTAVPTPPQPVVPVVPIAHVVPIVPVVPVGPTVPTRPSRIGRVRSFIMHAFNRIVDRLRPERDV